MQIKKLRKSFSMVLYAIHGNPITTGNYMKVTFFCPRGKSLSVYNSNLQLQLSS